MQGKNETEQENNMVQLNSKLLSNLFSPRISEVLFCFLVLFTNKQPQLYLLFVLYMDGLLGLTPNPSCHSVRLGVR